MAAVERVGTARAPAVPGRVGIVGDPIAALGWCRHVGPARGAVGRTSDVGPAAAARSGGVPAQPRLPAAAADLDRGAAAHLGRGPAVVHAAARLPGRARRPRRAPRRHPSLAALGVGARLRRHTDVGEPDQRWCRLRPCRVAAGGVCRGDGARARAHTGAAARARRDVGRRRETGRTPVRAAAAPGPAGACGPAPAACGDRGRGDRLRRLAAAVDAAARSVGPAAARRRRDPRGRGCDPAHRGSAASRRHAPPRVDRRVWIRRRDRGAVGPAGCVGRAWILVCAVPGSTRRAAREPAPRAGDRRRVPRVRTAARRVRRHVPAAARRLARSPGLATQHVAVIAGSGTVHRSRLCGAAGTVPVVPRAGSAPPPALEHGPPAAALARRALVVVRRVAP